MAFCEAILQAGGSHWEAASNLPAIVKATTFNPRNQRPKVIPPSGDGESSVTIEGPEVLREGQIGRYVARGVPPGGRYQWSPYVGERSEGGLYAVQAGYDLVSVRAEKSSGAALLRVFYVVGEKDAEARKEIRLVK